MQFFIFENCHSCIIEFLFSDLLVFHGTKLNGYSFRGSDSVLLFASLRNEGLH